jgi:hypothetical protein
MRSEFLRIRNVRSSRRPLAVECHSTTMAYDHGIRETLPSDVTPVGLAKAS